MKKKLPFLIIVLLVIGGSWRFYQKKMMENVYSGTVEATLIDLSSQLSSRIQEYRVTESTNVRAQTVLVTLTCEDVNVSHEQANKDWQRAQKLRHEGSISQENFEHAQSHFQEVDIKKSWCEITSPIEGTVLYTYKEKGELVMPGTKLVTVADLNNLWAYIYLSASDIKKVSLAKELQAYLPQLEKKIKVKVILINAQAEFTPKNVQTREERERLVYGVKVKLEPTDLKIYPGMNLEVSLDE